MKMRSSTFFYAGFEEERHPPHFLDSCLLCRKALSQKCDIYMYRGDKAFCSIECRQEQIDMDESSEKRLKISSAKRSTAVRQSKETSTEAADANKAVAVA